MNDQQIVYGWHAISSLVQRAPHRILQVFIAIDHDCARTHELIASLEDQGIAIHQIKKKKLESLIDPNSCHQGIVAHIKPQPAYNEQHLTSLLIQKEEPLLLILDGLTDPHNLGACLRTADAAGVQAVIIPRDRSVQLNATVRKVACGAAEIIPLVAVTNLVRTIKTLKELGIWVVGTCGQALINLYQLPLTGSLALVLGAEGKGMRRLTHKHCDIVANIPMAGSVSALNVSVAAGVSLFESMRQRRGYQISPKRS